VAPHRDEIHYSPEVAAFWHYRAKLSRQYWLVHSSQKSASVAVNGRETYWKSKAPIPGGMAFENFEIRRPFSSDVPLWFGVEPA
jgi:hypothetical protein